LTQTPNFTKLRQIFLTCNIFYLYLCGVEGKESRKKASRTNQPKRQTNKQNSINLWSASTSRFLLILSSSSILPKTSRVWLSIVNLGITYVRTRVNDVQQKLRVVERKKDIQYCMYLSIFLTPFCRRDLICMLIVTVT